MPNEEKNESELDDLAKNFFKQIGIEDFSGTIEFAKDLEKDIKKRESTIPKRPKIEGSEELKRIIEEKDVYIEKLEKLLEEKQDRVKELENKILSSFILMIKDYIEQINKLKDELKNKDEIIDDLKIKITAFKSKIQGLKSKWF
ncbi:MAG: hypothetical protein EAX96_12710 [Candidatus Lokiarchaeota archaeon]|nr:hypothetical protein [Candidatus Lokiarchaeota archaeon]